VPRAVQIVLLVLVFTAAYLDLRWRRIPNWLVLSGAVAGIGLNWFLLELDGLKLALMGLGLAMLIYFPLYLLRAMGAGDVKLMMAVGALVGWRIWLTIFILTGISGGIIAVVILLWQHRLRKTAWNIGFLLQRLLHLQVPYASNEELDVRSGKGLKLPHGAAIAVGTGIFMVVAHLLPGG
jgi:prepilin peptidase CpaA